MEHVCVHVHRVIGDFGGSSMYDLRLRVALVGMVKTNHEKAIINHYICKYLARKHAASYDIHY